MQFAGAPHSDKRAEVAEKIKAEGAGAALITAPASIAWVLNVRGGDVAHTPLVLARLLLLADGTGELYVDPQKAGPDLDAHLGEQIVRRSPDDLDTRLAALGAQSAKVLLDPDGAPSAYFESLAQAGAETIATRDPIVALKAAKNPQELQGARAAHERDGAALTRFLHWLSVEAPAGGVDEISAAKQLEAFRAETGLLKDISFDTISGAGPNGAIVHYRVTHESNRPLKTGELYLVDSGGQYEDGTTDVTRTVAIGAPTDEMRDRFTRVLKGHIAIAMAVFPEGTTGAHLDAFARAPLWRAGLDYDHGTGHGVGSYLGVHEGPQSIAKRQIAEPLRAGMILSNEPGYYKTDAYGIRIENLVIVRPELMESERAMLGFETLTLAPIDRELIDPSLLSTAEREWINAYHARVRSVITPLVPKDVQSWLAEATAEI